MATSANPKDSIKSTWRQADRSTWSFPHKLIDLVNIHHVDLNKEVPVHEKTDKVPDLVQWPLHVWILIHSFIPLLLQQAWAHYTGQNLSSIAAFFLYHEAFHYDSIREVHILRRLGHIYGFFDGDKHERDGVPDASVGKVVESLISTIVFRPLILVLFSYKPELLPSSINWKWLPLEIALYSIVLDFWFYWYHRLMHDVGPLWKFHRKHHLTKHPNPLLTIFADTEQEIGDLVGIPLMTFFTLRLMGLPMGFYEWWICVKYVLFAEIFGHSGLRIHSIMPSTATWLLTPLGASIAVEDHDLHHRKGWRKSHNYGKQTMLWDRIFGTYHDRLESTEQNIDYSDRVVFPFF
ncbi:hypothetical protein Plec18167_009495 [Paecilomyces lecythidis]|uniref:Fatty acid hydroxylase domain-containing protein n=1 Tax=Paecilomyces lecythidis TaxID=3004212 RepID=A0ABR3WP62_9EURO